MNKSVSSIARFLIAVFGVILGFYSAVLAEVFQAPVTSPVISCVYNSTNCYAVGSFHTAIDYDDASGLAIRAAASGTVALVMPLSGNDHGLGNCVIIEHHLESGTQIYSLYAHLNSIDASMIVGASVCQGQSVGIMGRSGYTSLTYWPSTHLHFELKNGPVLENPSGSGTYYGYTPSSADNFGYQNPSVYIGNTSRPVVPCGPAFAVQYVDQNISRLPWMRPGQTYTLQVRYRNVGTATWEKSGGVSNPNYLELRSVDGVGCNLYSSFCAYHSSWINRQRIVSFQETTVPPNSIGTFIFTAEMPSTSGECKQYTAPWASVGCVGDWAGVHFILQVDGVPPTSPGPVTVSPPSNNVNAFAFSWAASSDTYSGIAGYYWNVNGGSETFTTGTSLPAGAYATQQDGNTFTVRAVDIAGNSTSASTQFFYTVGGCGAPLPPCASLSSTAFTSISDKRASAPDNAEVKTARNGIMTLDQKSAQEWAAVGQPVSDVILPGIPYRVGFMYRTTSATHFGWAVIDSISVVGPERWQATTVANPLIDGEWHQFWSAPFIVSSEALANNARLTFFISGDGPSNVDIMNVELYRQVGDVSQINKTGE